MKIGFHLMLGLLLAGSVFANSIHQYDRIYGSTVVQLNTDFTNDDSGAVYDSYETAVFSNLVAGLWALPHNQAAYSNQTDMLDDWSLTISPGGEVNGNWTHDSNFSYLDLTHAPFGYDQWTTASNSDMMRLTLNIPLSQLDGDGDGWSAEDPRDYRIGLGEPTGGMGVGWWGTASFSATANPYEVEANPQATSNGTSIVWLEGYGWSNGFEAASVGNPDSDAYTTAQEYTLDTNPTNVTADFRLSFPGGTNPFVMRFSPSSTGRTYTVWHAGELIDPTWMEGATRTGTVGSTTITNDPGSSNRFFQLRVNRP